MLHKSRKPKLNTFLLCSGFVVVSFFLGRQIALTQVSNDLNAYSSTTTSLTADFCPAVTNEEDDKTNLPLFWEVWSKLEKDYVDDEALDSGRMKYGAVKGMVNALEDPYTVFMDPQESKEFNDSLHGTLEGIGAELTVEEKNLVIVTPLKNSPAEKAGLLPGDIIYKIDGEYAAEMTMFDAIMNIRGTKGTKVTLTILRKDLEDPFEVEIIRESIDLNSVTVEKTDDDIFYVSINQFNDKTLTEFNHAVSEIILDQPKGVIIDVRNNGGGYLDIAVDLLSNLLPSDKIAVVLKQKDKEKDVMKTKNAPKITNIPLVVLINEGSASASEILAGAVQAHKRGVVMGVKSFGKGTVQEVDSFSDGSSIRLTIAKWYTPDDKNIDKNGINPDILIEQDLEDLENKIDTQKEAAIKYLNDLTE